MVLSHGIAHLLNYMDTNKLFYNDQYGFRPRHSTELAAVRFVTDLIKDMDNYWTGSRST